MIRAMKYIIIGILILVANFAHGQAPKYSNEFLSVGVGSRALSMANANVALARGVTAGYWNPAALRMMESPFDASLMHAEYFAGIAKYDYMGFAMKKDTTAAWGVSLLRFAVDDIPNTTDLIDQDGNIDYGRVSYFSAADYALLFSYSKSTEIPGLSVGANVKIIYRNIGEFASAWGFGIDAAVHYKMEKWNFAAMARDVTSTFNAWSFNEEELAIEVEDSLYNLAPENSLELTLPRLILGVSRDFVIYDKIGASVETDIVFTFDGKRNVLAGSEVLSLDPVVGLELDYNNFFFVRAGLGNIQQVQEFSGQSWSMQPNMGLGVKYKGFAIDYALTDIGDQSVALYSNIFTLSYSFGEN